MTVEEVAPKVDRNAVLPGAQFADAYRVAVSDAGLDARKAAEKLFARGPRWLEALFVLRAALVASGVGVSAASSCPSGPVAAGGLGGSSKDGDGPAMVSASDVVPGSAVSVQLIRGDLEIAATCTLAAPACSSGWTRSLRS